MTVKITFTDSTEKTVHYDFDCVALLYTALMNEYKDVKSIECTVED
jgi:hypothetical protein